MKKVLAIILIAAIALSIGIIIAAEVSNRESDRTIARVDAVIGVMDR